MSALTRWRSHAHRGIHRVGRDLGIPRGARVPLAGVLAVGLACAGYWQYNRVKAGDTVLVDAGVFVAVAPGVVAGQQTQAKVTAVGPAGFTLAPIVAGQQIPATVTVPATTKLVNTTPRIV